MKNGLFLLALHAAGDIETFSSAEHLIFSFSQHTITLSQRRRSMKGNLFSLRFFSNIQRRLYFM
jgi:hypothetical protein